jgi:phosphatidylglycerol:prolipoprotein diacylglycerol transferase
VFTHDIDPIIVTVGGVHLWWYGAGFALGFWQIHRYLRRHRTSLGLTLRDVYTLSLCIVVGVLLGGRTVEVLFDEWGFYRTHPSFVPRYWLGGMATHGLLIGAALGTAAFAWWQRRPFRELADALVVPGALLMGLGRLGNFIDGLIVGRVTDVWWDVTFPDAAGPRHPVVLYDGLKNLALVPYLAHVRRTIPTPGATAARFVFWYAATRIVIDLFRDYPTHRLALGTGQTLNIAMALLGLVLLARSAWRRRHGVGASPVPPVTSEDAGRGAPTWSQRAVLVILLLLCLTIPSNWTQDVPARYGTRHPGLEHSWLYPAIDTRPR